MTEHAIRWTFDDGIVRGQPVCHADPGADCRLTSVSCECEQWGEIRRDEDGTIWHKILDYGDSNEPRWHEVKLQDDCNVCLFLEADFGLEELAVKGTRFEIAETPLRPVWDFDGCEWEPVLPPSEGSERGPS